MDTLPAFRFVTGSLHVDYLKLTPITATLEICGRVKEIKGRKVIVQATVWVDRVTTASEEQQSITAHLKNGWPRFARHDGKGFDISASALDS